MLMKVLCVFSQQQISSSIFYFVRELAHAWRVQSIDTTLPGRIINLYLMRNVYVLTFFMLNFFAKKQIVLRVKLWWISRQFEIRSLKIQLNYSFFNISFYEMVPDVDILRECMLHQIAQNRDSTLRVTIDWYLVVVKSIIRQLCSHP